MHLLTQSALLKALGWSLFNSLWQMALLWVLYRILLVLFPKTSAHTRHGLSCLLLGTGMVWAALSGASPWPDGIFQTGAQWGTSFWQAGRLLIREALPYCSVLYLLTLAFLFIRYANRYLQSRQLKREGLSKIQPELRVFITKTSRLMGIRREVRIWLSSLVEVPVTLGFLKPVILIPLATVNNLSLPQAEAVLLHELAHIKRNDYLLHLGVTVLDVLFFFNPFSRLLIRDIQREREHRCDDMVMQFRYDPHTYVAALLSLATAAAGSRGSRQLVLAATGSNDQFLLKRVRRILQLQEAKDRPGARTMIFLLFILAGTFMLLSRSTGNSTFFKNSVSSFVINSVRSSGNTKPSPSGRTVLPPSVPILSEENIYPIGSILGTTGYVHASNVSREKPPIIKTSFVSYTIVAKSPVSITHTRRPPVLIRATGAENDPSGDNEGTTADEMDGADAPPAEEVFASTVQADNREYSMAPALSLTLTAPAKKQLTRHQPFVPNSSWSFQQVEDTTRLQEQYAYLQSLASHEVEEAVKKMQKQLQVQLRVLQQTQSKERRATLEAQRRLLEEQLKLQQSFLRQQQELERKLERAGKIRRIVVI